jgi:hypothetical protein
MGYENTRQFATTTTTIGGMTFKHHGVRGSYNLVIKDEFICIVSLATITSSVLLQQLDNLSVGIFIEVFLNGISIMS